jgi:hypothetical protein
MSDIEKDQARLLLAHEMAYSLDIPDDQSVPLVVAWDGTPGGYAWSGAMSVGDGPGIRRPGPHAPGRAMPDTP